MSSPLYKNLKIISPAKGLNKNNNFKRILCSNQVNIRKTVNSDKLCSPLLANSMKSEYFQDICSPLKNCLKRKCDISIIGKSLILGRGSFGIVIKANNLAIKIVTSKTDQKRILNNERNIRNFKNKNIISIYQVIMDKELNLGLIIMELWSSINLQKYLHENIINDVNVKIKYMLDITEGLQYCHINKLIHLDIKPSNVLINSRTHECKICDFGNSYSLQFSNSWNIGTVQFAAPELLIGKKPTEKCDIYSLGITMWHIIHQKIPFLGYDNHAVIYQVVKNKMRPDLSKFQLNNNNYENRLKNLIQQCWHSDPFLRPAIECVIDSLLFLK